MLQWSPAECARLLAHIWQTCRRLAIHPKLWKQGTLIPIHKKGPQHLPENYRPICMLPHARAMIEHAISSAVTSEFIPHHNHLGFVLTNYRLRYSLGHLQHKQRPSPRRDSRPIERPRYNQRILPIRNVKGD